jgi:hypothetical protein
VQPVPSQTAFVDVSIRPIQLVAYGGTTPYAFSATGLPAGLSCSLSGLITGSPTTAGATTATAIVTDALSNTANTPILFTVSVPAIPIAPIETVLDSDISWGRHDTIGAFSDQQVTANFTYNRSNTIVGNGISTNRGDTL